jgi:hypothetical protein
MRTLLGRMNASFVDQKTMHITQPILILKTTFSLACAFENKYNSLA